MVASLLPNGQLAVKFIPVSSVESWKIIFCSSTVIMGWRRNRVLILTGQTAIMGEIESGFCVQIVAGDVLSSTLGGNLLSAGSAVTLYMKASARQS
ncbi:MAG: hypothetical protein HQK70_15180 [Desulfamplus sp.]|nr:hypothetical protein [Desulfamplus sp.]